MYFTETSIYIYWFYNFSRKKLRKTVIFRYEWGNTIQYDIEFWNNILISFSFWTQRNIMFCPMKITPVPALFKLHLHTYDQVGSPCHILNCIMSPTLMLYMWLAMLFNHISVLNIQEKKTQMDYNQYGNIRTRHINLDTLNSYFKLDNISRFTCYTQSFSPGYNADVHCWYQHSIQIGMKHWGDKHVQNPSYTCIS